MTLDQPSVLFPLATGGVLLPRRDRRAAQLGLTLYTASKPRVLVAQRAAFWAIGVLGPAVLPGRRSVLHLPEWDELTASWVDEIGPVKSVAQYQRKDPRAGMLMLVTREGGSPLIVKVRHEGSRVVAEQRLLAALQDLDLGDIRVPEPFAHGMTQHGLTWAAQRFVFERPHQPVFRLEQTQLAVLAAGIAEAFVALGWSETRGDGWSPAHGDLTPWNLRRDHQGRIWLIDWEDAAYLPPAADQTYLALTAATLLDTAAGSLDSDAVAHWRTVIESRLAAGHPKKLESAMLARLRPPDALA